MKTLTGVSTSFPAQKTIEDADDANESVMDVVMQSSADRAEYLNNIIAALGVPRLRWLDLAGVQALTGMTTGEVIVMRAGTHPYGVLVFNSASSATHNPPYVVQPTSGSGRWENILYPYLYTGGGTGDDAVRWEMPVPHSIVAHLEVVETSSTRSISSAASGWVDLPSFPTITRTMALGDVIDLYFSGLWSVTALEDPNFRIHVTAPSGAAALPGSEITIAAPAAANKAAQVVLDGRWTATEAGDHVFSLQGRTDTGGGPFGLDFLPPRALRGQHYRS
jgi:hypothetical protein